MTIKNAYSELMKKWKEVIHLDNISKILQWDFETYMPPKGVEQRAQEIALITSLEHTLKTDKRIGELIEQIKNDLGYQSLNEITKRNIYLIEKNYNRNVKIPKELAEEIAKHAPIAIQTWKTAKKMKDYSIFKPELEKTLELVKKKAKYIDPTKDAYTVLMDEFEPGMTPEQVSIVFDEMKAGLIPLIKKCTSSMNQPDLSVIKRRCPIEIQRKISHILAKLVHYDLEKGSIDETEHPFTNGYYDDVRITTHYHEDDFTSSFYAVLHEAGHALYEQNLSHDFIYQPVGEACSYGIHESQSRFIENLIGRTGEFWEYYMPQFIEHTGDIFADVDLDTFIHAINNVQPSKIRIFADEVTYSLHIIIRFEIEKDLIAGKITTEELPHVWNKKYKDYLGVDIQHDSEGVMQDTHWASGYFGYFPSYALGNIYNAQMLQILMRDIPNYYQLIKEGKLKPIINWLIENVHKKSNLYDPPDLMKKISGEEINPKYFINYLEEKFSKIYGF